MIVAAIDNDSDLRLPVAEVGIGCESCRRKALPARGGGRYGLHRQCLRRGVSGTGSKRMEATLAAHGSELR